MRWCCLLVVAAIIFTTLACENSTNLSRKRRYLVFPKNARAGIRVNFKHNRVVPITTILAYSDGMRLTWDLPSDLAYLKPIMLGRRAAQRRDVLDFIERGMSEFGLDGEACVLRAMCEAADQVVPVSGLIKKILHRIFAIPEDEMGGGGTAREILPRERSGNCEQRFARRCPISLLGPSTLQQDAPRQELHPRD
ncbi:hypothetical protein B566_EDAN008666 [Ephemera danica]|nr:hypothetical protein B566_EDAN008666 [Ephemera danica]